jgi:hypothetical protein
VSAEPSPKANPMDVVFQNVWFRLIYLLFFATEITVLWFVLGPASKFAAAAAPWYAMGVTWGTCALVPAVPAPALVRRVPPQWFRVPTGERLIYRIAGVEIFGWLLDVSGWNRLITPMRGFSGKAGLLSLEQHARAGAIAHGICFAIHVLLAVLALFSRHPLSGALWMLLPGVVVHLYPVLLQRAIMLRLQPLLDKSGSADWVGR